MKSVLPRIITPFKDLTSREQEVFDTINHLKGEQIGGTLPNNHKTYDFWFLYYEGEEPDLPPNIRLSAYSWEGGFDLTQHNHFRNKYSLLKGGKLRLNW